VRFNGLLRSIKTFFTVCVRLDNLESQLNRIEDRLNVIDERIDYLNGRIDRIYEILLNDER